MGWLGMITVVLHYLAPDSKGMQTVVGFLKWMSLMIGVPMAFAFLASFGMASGLDGNQRQLLLIWSIGNIAAFFIIRNAEQKRLEERTER